MHIYILNIYTYIYREAGRASLTEGKQIGATKKREAGHKVRFCCLEKAATENRTFIGMFELWKHA